MGQSNSKATYYNNKVATDLIREIQTRAKKLNDSYSYEFLDDQFCNRVALLYNDKLSKFRKQDIDNVRYTLGIVNDDPEIRDRACKLIVDHYIKRIKLINKIQQNMDYCLNRIFALTVGPKCNNFPEVFSEQECSSKGGGWIETVILPDDALAENRPWFQQVHNMQNEYINYLKRLESIMVQFDDFDEYVTDERLTALELEFDKLSHRINQTTFERYRMILGTRTYSAEEIAEQRARQKELADNYAAQRNAMRVSKGLPPLRL